MHDVSAPPPYHAQEKGSGARGVWVVIGPSGKVVQEWQSFTGEEAKRAAYRWAKRLNTAYAIGAAKARIGRG